MGTEFLEKAVPWRDSGERDREERQMDRDRGERGDRQRRDRRERETEERQRRERQKRERWEKKRARGGGETVEREGTDGREREVDVGGLRLLETLSGAHGGQETSGRDAAHFLSSHPVWFSSSRKPVQDPSDLRGRFPHL